MATDDGAFLISEYEQAEELQPGLSRIAGHLLEEVGKLVRGEAHALSRTLLEGNPAWPPLLAEAARRGELHDRALHLVIPLALSRTQDDKGNNRWTLFGLSHDGPAAAFWRSLEGTDASGFARLVERLSGAGTLAAVERGASVDPVARGINAAGVDSAASATSNAAARASISILARRDEVPAQLQALLVDREALFLAAPRTLVTFTPFAELPLPIQHAYLARTLELVPSPASLVFAHHPRYPQLARELPRAQQIPLLHLFPRVTTGCAIRIPQSGWLDELEPAQQAGAAHAHGQGAHGHRVHSHVARSHRWQRIARDQAAPVEQEFLDKVTIALFSTRPDDLGLYGKPMARNAQVWSDDYSLLLDGPRATREELRRAAGRTERGGRFGYRFYFPPMRAGARELFWHLPLLARRDPHGGHAVLIEQELPREPGESAAAPVCPLALRGYLSAEHLDPALAPLFLEPVLLARPAHRLAATLFTQDPGHRRFTTSQNAHKLLEFSDYLGRKLDPSLARALLRLGKETTLAGWLTQLPSQAVDARAGEELAAALRGCIGEEPPPAPALTFAATHGRDFEEKLWRSIASLAEGEFRHKENADAISVNQGRSGGPAAAAAHIVSAERRDLEQLGEHLHARYRELIAQAGMEGRAEVVDHVFTWETEFDYPWSLGWKENQSGAARERNIVCRIPGRNRSEAILMGDHYDTAYMEDVYEAARGGDSLRAAARGADDNHSATTALLLAAEVLLKLSREGKLERDVWLVHLTGEEFPADCLGARALVRALIEGRLAFTTEAGAVLDVSQVRITGAYILDMIGHNSERARDVFQIAPGEGAASARLAERAHLANQRWNRAAAEWNQAGRAHLGRAARMPDGSAPPPPFKHLPLAGEVRTEWEPKSSLYNTDGQILSDNGVPVVLFMENYDLNRTGYHDTHDTMKNIDLDYAAALTAIAIETVADAACAPGA